MTSLPYGVRANNTGAGPLSGIHTSVARAAPSRIGTIKSRSTRKFMIDSPPFAPAHDRCHKRTEANFGPAAGIRLLPLGGIRRRRYRRGCVAHSFRAPAGRWGAEKG